MEFVFIVLGIIAIFVFLVFFLRPKADLPSLTPTEVIRNAEAMHQYDHDEQAIFLLQEYSSRFPQDRSLREKLIQIEASHQKKRKQLLPH